MSLQLNGLKTPLTFDDARALAKSAAAYDLGPGGLIAALIAVDVTSRTQALAPLVPLLDALATRAETKGDAISHALAESALLLAKVDE